MNSGFMKKKGQAGFGVFSGQKDQAAATETDRHCLSRAQGLGEAAKLGRNFVPQIA